MADESQHHKGPHPKSAIVGFLELGDGLAHMLVATLLLLLALGVLFVSTYNLFRELVEPGSLQSFSEIGLSYLSELLLAVIILELLSTILTYIHARNLEATIKDFLIVGLISSVRKILLIGAQSSLEGNQLLKGGAAAEKASFVNESIGTVITIFGILLLIGGLILLDHRKKLASKFFETTESGS